MDTTKQVEAIVKTEISRFREGIKILTQTPLRIIFFVLWLIIYISVFFIPPGDFHENEYWIPTLITFGPINVYLVFTFIFRLFLLIMAIYYLILHKKKTRIQENKIILKSLIITLILSLFSVTIIATISKIAYMVQTILSFYLIADIVRQKTDDKVKLYEKNVHPGKIILVISIAMIIIVFPLANMLKEDAAESVAFLYIFYILVPLIGLSTYYLIRKRNDRFYHHIKTMYLWYIPLSLGYILYMVLTIAITPFTSFDMGPALMVASSLVFIILGLYDLTKDIVEKKAENKDSYQYVLWIYLITIGVQFTELSSMADFGSQLELMMFFFTFVYTLIKLIYDIAQNYKFRKFNLLLFLGNKLEILQGSRDLTNTDANTK